MILSLGTLLLVGDASATVLPFLFSP
jgi:hypothetical protein